MAWFKWPPWRKDEPVIARSIIGDDDRLPAENYQDNFWRPMCAIFMTYPGHSLPRLGTGVLIAPRLMLTAAHNLYDLRAGAAITNGTVKVGLSEGTFGAQSTIRSIRVPDAYKQSAVGSTDKYAYDYGLALLSDNLAHNWANTVWPLEDMVPPSDTALTTSRLIVAGYPAELGASGTKLMMANGPIKENGAANRSFAYDIDTTGGQSGSPVFKYHAQTETAAIFGVHVAGFGQRGNLANRFTQETKTQILAWADELTRSEPMA